MQEELLLRRLASALASDDHRREVEERADQLRQVWSATRDDITEDGDLVEETRTVTVTVTTNINVVGI